ncbi:MAG TPA: LysR family transcriptional regulator [Candidatus Limnocylindria bacterium]
MADLFQDLQLRHLVALQAIAETGSFWAAAERLECSPSALSQQIAGLEETVGQRLIERSRGKRHVALTEPGRLLLRHADAVVARLRAAQADLVAFRDGELGTLRIGTFQSVGAKILPRLHREFSAEWPKIELRVIEGGNEDELLALLARGELDATFTVLPVTDPAVEAVELMRDPYVLAVPAGSKLAKTKSAKLEQLGALDLIGFRQSRSIAHIEETLLEHGVQPKFVFRSDDNGIVQGMVAAGAGCALVPLLALDEKDPAIHVVRLPEIPPRVLAIGWGRDRYRSPAATAFVAHARRIFAAFMTPARHMPAVSSTYA